MRWVPGRGLLPAAEHARSGFRVLDEAQTPDTDSYGGLAVTAGGGGSGGTALFADGRDCRADAGSASSRSSSSSGHGFWTSHTVTSRLTLSVQPGLLLVPSVEGVNGLCGRDVAAHAKRDRDNWVPTDGRLQLGVALCAGWGKTWKS